MRNKSKKISSQPAAPKGDTISVAALRRKGFWRCGRQFHFRDPKVFGPDDLTPDELKLIRAEPNLVVKDI